RLFRYFRLFRTLPFHLYLSATVIAVCDCVRLAIRHISYAICHISYEIWHMAYEIWFAPQCRIQSQTAITVALPLSPFYFHFAPTFEMTECNTIWLFALIPNSVQPFLQAYKTLPSTRV